MYISNSSLLRQAQSSSRTYTTSEGISTSQIQVFATQTSVPSSSSSPSLTSTSVAANMSTATTTSTTSQTHIPSSTSLSPSSSATTDSISRSVIFIIVASILAFLLIVSFIIRNIYRRHRQKKEELALLASVSALSPESSPKNLSTSSTSSTFLGLYQKFQHRSSQSMSPLPASDRGSEFSMASRHDRNVSISGRSLLLPASVDVSSGSQPEVNAETHLMDMPHVHPEAQYADSIGFNIPASLSKENEHRENNRSIIDQIPLDTTAEGLGPVPVPARDLPNALTAGAREIEQDKANELERAMLEFDVTKLP